MQGLDAGGSPPIGSRDAASETSADASTVAPGGDASDAAPPPGTTDAGTTDDASPVPIPPGDWQDLQSILSGIAGNATAPIGGVVTNLYTPGMLMGNGDLGVVAGGTTTTTQVFHFAKNDFWGSAWAPSHNVLINSLLSMGTLTVSSPMPSANPASAYQMVEDILNAEVRTTMQLGASKVTMRSWTADSGNIFVTELSVPAGGAPATIQIDLGMPPTDVAVQHTTYPFSVGASGAVLWATRSNNATVIDTPGNIGGSADPMDYETRVGVAVAAIGSTLTSVNVGAADVSGLVTVNPGATVPIVTVFENDTRIGPSGPSPSALQSMAVAKVSALAQGDVDALRVEHRTWWKNFWLESYVRLGDPVLEAFYYGALYAVGSASRAGHVPPGIFGNYITNDSPDWGGRYVLNYNAEAPFYGVFSSNRPELALPYTDLIFAVEPWQQNHTAQNGYQGVEYQRALSPFAMAGPPPAPVPVAGTKNVDLTDQKSNASFAALPTIWYYEYTRDDDYLRNKLYPHLKALDAFWRDYLTFDGTHYVVEQSATHEEVTPVDTNPNSDLGFLRKIEKTLIAASTELGVDAPMQSVWQDVLDKLSPYPTGTFQGKTVFFLAQSIGGNTSPTVLFEPGNQPVNMEGPTFPGEDIELGGDPTMIQIAIDSLTLMNSWGVTSGGNSSNGFCKEFPIAAREGWPGADLVAKFKAAIQYHWRPSNLTVAQSGGGIETSGSIETINSMLLQSEGGVIRVFPVWPTTMDAYFRRLRAKGAFVLSGDLKGGQVTGITITSEKGGAVNLVSPWTSGTPVVHEVDGAGNVLSTVSSMTQNGVLTFATSAGSTYQIASGP
jgi:hypothetical protein